ncbi:MAG TPA: hypothetical protein VFY90_07340, partial [Tepidiformaceae bacterium]|nr:hypothetical protein [Tepidiformaceae bacterium]
GQFDEPVGLAFASDGTAFVADMYNSRVVMLDVQGNVVGQFKVDGWGGREVPNKPYLEPLRDGRVAVSLPGSDRVRIYRRDGTVSGEISAEDPVKQPYGMLETADAKLWVVEGGSGRIRQFEIP